MVSDELIANLFRISQTEQKLKRDNVKGEVNANDVHFEVGKKIKKYYKRTWRHNARRLSNSRKEFKSIRKGK